MNRPVENISSTDVSIPRRKSRKPSGLLGVAMGAGAVLILAAGSAYWGIKALGHETTEDAYVDGNVVQVTPQIAGTVTSIAADNTDFVKAGQPLIRLNALDARLALERAEAQLSKAVRQARVQYATAMQMQANVAQRKADLSKAEADLARRRQLSATGAISGEDFRHAEDAVKSARAAYAAAAQQQSASIALVDGTRIENHPDVLGAASQVRDAYVALHRTTLAAPVSGIVTKRNVQLGQRVAPGMPMMAIVPLDQIWINANFKESQLRHVRIGQPVKVTADVYGKDVVYTGRIVGQDAGTGSAFSLLPAQNATGNWIKVVQRVPVRIVLDSKELQAHPLRLGLSMKVDVDVHDQSGAMISRVGAATRTYETNVFAGEAAEADRVIQRIMRANLGDSAQAAAKSGREES